MTQGQFNFLDKLKTTYPNINANGMYNLVNRFYGDIIKADGRVALAYQYAIDCERNFHELPQTNYKKRKYFANQLRKAKDLMITLNSEAYSTLLD